MAAALNVFLPPCAFVGTPLALNVGINAHGFDSSYDVVWAVDGLPEGLTATPTDSSLAAGLFFITETFLVDINAATDVVTTRKGGVAVPHKWQAGDRLSTTMAVLINTPIYILASGLTSTSFKVSTSVGGSPYNFESNSTDFFSFGWAPNSPIYDHISDSYGPALVIRGTPAIAGIYDLTFAASGNVNGVFTTVQNSAKLIVEGAGLLAYFHLDYTADPVVARPGLDLQYDIVSRTFASGTWNTQQPLDFYLGQSRRLYFLPSERGTRTLPSTFTPLLPAAAPTDVTLTIRTADQFDAPPFYQALEETGTVTVGLPGATTRDVVYFDVTIASRFLDRIFTQLNAPSVAEPASAFLPAVMQISFTLAGQRYTTPEYAVRIRQPHAR